MECDGLEQQLRRFRIESGERMDKDEVIMINNVVDDKTVLIALVD